MRAFTKAVWLPGKYEAVTANGVEDTADEPVLTKLPCCEAHNTRLGAHFEQHGQEAAKQLFGLQTVKDDRGRTKDYRALSLDHLTALEMTGTEQFARWVVKTMVLDHHPQAVREMNGRRVWKRRQPAGFPEPVFADVFNGTIPAGMNAWIAISDLAGTDRPAGSDARVSLDVSASHPAKTAQLTLGVRHGSAGRQVHLQLVWAPGMVVVHPDEESGAATRLWPRPPQTLRIADMPVLDPFAAACFRSTFIEDGWSFVFEPDRMPVMAEGVRTMSVREVDGVFASHSWPMFDDAERVAAIIAHLGAGRSRQRST
ncbi:hypothetical protein SAMN05216298_0423 [Glycomyces sambucus]|uniref:Uncharacterized protein n=2 Tax=Glycomyces sambucus TaxID=380244 RepID=A0A1G9CNA6_9ACTN|nr:hypothetical protein SAMN05216298_0423 [Glycomyces sambucus]